MRGKRQQFRFARINCAWRKGDQSIEQIFD
jgi:hypothetical protein